MSLILSHVCNLTSSISVFQCLCFLSLVLQLDMVTHFTSTNFKWGERHRGEHKNDAVLKHVDSHFNPLPALLRLTFCLNDYKGPLELSIPTGAPRSDSCHGNPLILEGTELPLGMNSKRRPAPVTQRSPEPQRQPWHSKSGKKRKI